MFDAIAPLSVVESILRWLHVFAGIVWIGHLYFFNFVNGPFAGTMDGETKKKVVPELMPRALYFFRWGAAWTWITGVLLIAMIFYHGKLALAQPANDFGGSAWGMVAVTFLAVFVYDLLAAGPLKDPTTMFWAGWILSTVALFLFEKVGQFGVRGYSIHLGALFGTNMAYNVWFRIWPNQQKIITAVKEGQPPDAALVATAGLRSKHNTYMSVPLIFVMMNSHSLWINSPLFVSAAILVGWATTYHVYQKASQVKGF